MSRGRPDGSARLPAPSASMGPGSLGQMNGPLFARFVTRAGLPGDASLRQVVNAVQAVPYGRPRVRTAEGVIGEWKGTCSTKHALLARLLGDQWPELQWHHQPTMQRPWSRDSRQMRMSLVAGYKADAELI